MLTVSATYAFIRTGIKILQQESGENSSIAHLIVVPYIHAVLCMQCKACNVIWIRYICIVPASYITVTLYRASCCNKLPLNQKNSPQPTEPNSQLVPNMQTYSFVLSNDSSWNPYFATRNLQLKMMILKLHLWLCFVYFRVKWILNNLPMGMSNDSRPTKYVLW
jgi:hypothetical protein